MSNEDRKHEEKTSISEDNDNLTRQIHPTYHQVKREPSHRYTILLKTKSNIKRLIVFF